MSSLPTRGRRRLAPTLRVGVVITFRRFLADLLVDAQVFATGSRTVDDFVVRQSLRVPSDSIDFHNPQNWRGFRSGRKPTNPGAVRICLLSGVRDVIATHPTRNWT